jgi:drug/metabolite transporter (DMT)-like permease
MIGTGLTTIIWFWLIQKYEAGRLSLYLFLIPVFGLFIAFMVFDEILQFFEIIGIVLVISAIGMSVMNEHNHNKKSKR